jgi:hypothetical protein
MENIENRPSPTESLEELLKKPLNEHTPKGQAFKAKYEEAFAYGRSSFFNDMNEFINKLRQKYGNEELNRRELYHALSSSGYSGEWISDDFEGDDSLEKFLDERYNYYKAHPVLRKTKQNQV